MEDQSAKLLHASAPDTSLPPLDQVNAGLEVYIECAERHPDGFRVAQHAAVTDPDLGRIHQARVSVHRDRILAGLGTLTTVDERTQIAVAGWLAFVTTAILEWLDNRAITREQLRALSARTLWAAVGLSDG